MVAGWIQEYDYFVLPPIPGGGSKQSTAGIVKAASNGDNTNLVRQSDIINNKSKV
jgi:hypothetical protein